MLFGNRNYHNQVQANQCKIAKLNLFLMIIGMLQFVIWIVCLVACIHIMNLVVVSGPLFVMHASSYWSGITKAAGYKTDQNRLCRTMKWNYSTLREGTCR